MQMHMGRLYSLGNHASNLLLERRDISITAVSKNVRRMLQHTTIDNIALIKSTERRSVRYLAFTRVYGSTCIRPQLPVSPKRCLAVFIPMIASTAGMNSAQRLSGKTCQLRNGVLRLYACFNRAPQR